MAHVNYQTVVDWDVTLKDVGYTDTDTIGETFAGLVESAVKITAGAPTATAMKFIPAAIVQNAVTGIGYINSGSTAAPVWSVISVGGGGGMVIGGAVTGGTATQLLFVGAGAVLDQSASLTWNDATQVLSVLGTNPGTSLVVDNAGQSITASAKTPGFVGGSSLVYLSGANIQYNGPAANWGFRADTTGGGQTAIIANNVQWAWPNADAVGALTSNGAGVLSFAVPSPIGSALVSGNIIVGSAGNLAASVAMSGDASIIASGAVTVTGATGGFIAGGSITNAGGTLFVPFYPVSSLPQSLSGPGAANITTFQTLYTSTGAGDVVTVASATRIGHMKKITYVAEAGGGDTAVVTPTATTGFTTATLNAIGDYVVLAWDGAGYIVMEYFGATIA